VISLRVATGVCALALLAMLPLRTWLGPAFGKDMTRHHPYAALSQAVRQHCPAARTIVTESLLSAGNLRFARPAQWPPCCWKTCSASGPALIGPAALVAHAHDAPAALAAFHAAWPDVRLEQREEISLAIEDGSGRRMAFVLACTAPKPPPEGPIG
jgi:hypothetical protein